VSEAPGLESWLLAECQALLACGRRPLLALNGPVGAGKSTLSGRLYEQFAAAGLQLAVASIDDAYWPWPERQRRMADNPFGVSRVPPGSHDPLALLEPLHSWRQQPWPPLAPLRLPRFDKTLLHGEGDRCADWQGVADAVLLEGWLVGCQPLQSEPLERGLAELGLSPAACVWVQRCNRTLQAYVPLWQEIDRLLLLWPQNWQLPRRWRFQAEARQRRRGGGWLGAVALQNLVDASLQSLPQELYQRPLLQQAGWIRVLDGRRRTLLEGDGDAVLAELNREAQASSSCSSLTG
jgi:D-glycerate 3-kinase